MSSALEGLVRKHPEVAPAAATLSILASALPEVTLPGGIPHPGAARARLEAGIPALEGEPLLSGSALLANVRVLAIALGPTVPAECILQPALERQLNETDLEQLAAAALSGAWDWCGAMADRLSTEPDALVTLVDHAARPALRAGALAVRDVVVQSRWKRGTCPACGAAPLLAELRGGGSSVSGGEQERVLRCGRCLTAWGYPRLSCVGCGESNHQRLAYLHGEGEGAFRRAEVCSTCHGYIKSIAVLAPLSMTELLGTDLATAALDLAAVERGFHR